MTTAATIKLAYSEGGRFELLVRAKDVLQDQVCQAIDGLAHIDRVTFRVKKAESFAGKALDPKNNPRYENPLREIDDQIAGRIIVCFAADIASVRSRLESFFTPVEYSTRRPSKYSEFGYESEHALFLLPPQVRGAEWEARKDLPANFEVQLRTVFMHAFAEPQHFLDYKAAQDLPIDARRELAWIAATSWGADQSLRRLRESSQRENRPSND